MSSTETALPLSTRLINNLAAGAERDEFQFVGGSTYQVWIDGYPRSGTRAQMWAWLDGLARGRMLPERMDGPVRVPGWWSTGGVEAATQRLACAREDVAGYRRILVDPSLVDQLRIEVLTAMQVEKITFKDLADRIGKSAQAVRDALSFTAYHLQVGTTSLFDQMIRGCGRRFVIGSTGPVQTDLILSLGGARTEPSGLTRMRALLIGVEAQLIDGVAPQAPNRARRAREFVVSQAGAELVKSHETIVHWLQGLADGAQHRQARAALTFDEAQH